MSLHSSAPEPRPIKMKGEPNRAEKCFGWIHHITVEPAIFLYMMSYTITSVVEQEFFVQKACRVDHDLSEEICKNLSTNATIQAQVQVTVSTFHQWNDIARHAIPIILALFIGSWSDRRGRKTVLVMALIGKIIYSGMMVMNALMPSWNVNTIVYSASLPMTLLGSDVAIFTSCFAYISDVSSTEQRTLRVGIADVVAMITLPAGIALGSYLFNNIVNGSYTTIFTISAALQLLATIDSVARLKMRTTAQQTPLEKGTNLFFDFFDKKHVVATAITLVKPRPAHRRLYLWILLLAMALYVFHQNERQMSYLYSQLVFSWNVSTFSTFLTFQSSLSAVAVLFGLPIMNKLLGMRDTMIIAVGALSHAFGRVFYATTSIPELFYVGAAITAMGPTVLPTIRSMSSKIVSSAERGKVFVLLSVFNNAALLISGPLYTQLYNATLTTTPSAIHWLTVASQISILMLIMVIHVGLGKRRLECETSENSKNLGPQPTARGSTAGISTHVDLSSA